MKMNQIAADTSAREVAAAKRETIFFVQIGRNNHDGAGAAEVHLSRLSGVSDTLDFTPRHCRLCTSPPSTSAGVNGWVG
jgi:hypothetical protein